MGDRLAKRRSERLFPAPVVHSCWELAPPADPPIPLIPLSPSPHSVSACCIQPRGRLLGLDGERQQMPCLNQQKQRRIFLSIIFLSRSAGPSLCSSCPLWLMKI